MSRKVNLFRQSECADADVQAFVAAAAITDGAIKYALCVLVNQLKVDGIWTKCDAIYPFVGGSASAHKFNLKNPADTNAAFRLTFSGGWTHAATGATPNGVNAFANTFWTPSVNSAITRCAFGIYSRTNSLIAGQIYGCQNSSINRFVSHSIDSAYFRISAATNQIIYSASPTQKLLMARRTSTTVFEAYRDGVSLGTSAALASTLPDRNFYLGALNNGFNAGANFTVHELAFAFLAGISALTDTDAVNLTNAVNTFQTSLGRAV
jgi:hypothetical protein